MKIVPLCAVLILSASQPVMAQPSQSQKVCLQQNLIYGWDVVDDKNLIVTDRARKKFAVTLMPGCYDLKFSLRLGFKAFSGSDLSCLGHNDYVLVPPNAGRPRQRCLISDVQAYNAAPPSGSGGPSK